MPNMVLIGLPAPSLRSRPTIDHAPPDPLVQDSWAVCGNVTTDGLAVVAVEANGAVDVCPPAV